MGFKDKYSNKYQTGGLQYLFASHVIQEGGEELFDKYFKFSIIRNPWDRIVSQFNYMSKRPDLRSYIGMDENSSFKKYLSLIQKKNHVQWDHQYKFVYDSNGELMIDRIGRFENLNPFLYSVMEKLHVRTNFLGFKRKIPHLNKSNKESYKLFYDQESIEIVKHIYRKDIEIFDYTF